ncbi:TPA: hypothetical protein MC588_002898 [Citrobacter amalonaticus]|nr:hypothetical protein [Citrobacter amalonaticus]
MKLDVTPAQLEAIKRLTDDCASMMDDSDKAWARYVDLIDRMLKKNGHERSFKGED